MTIFRTLACHGCLCSALLSFAVQGSAEVIGKPIEISARYRSGDRFMNMRLLGTVRLFNTPLNGLAASELSGLAWDEDDQILYAVSDAGHLLHIRPQFLDDRLSNVDLIATHVLRSRKGRALPRYLTDAEALAIRNGNNGIKGDASLLVSFEGTPRIDAYTPEGNFIENLPLPDALAQAKNYACRNCQLESIALHPSLGVMVSPQRPLRDASRDMHTVYDLLGHTWTFPPVARDHCAIVDLCVTPNGQLLVLERRYKNIFSPVLFAIRRLPADMHQRSTGAPLTAENVAVLDNTEGWSVDNFEGITHHVGNRYFMVSDDNNSALLSTLLVYFEIPE